MTSWPIRGMWIMPHCWPAQSVADADPAGAVGVILALAVPVELDFHAAVLVGEDLVARVTDDDRGLGTLDDGRGVVRAGLNGQRSGMQRNVFEYSDVLSCPVV